MRDLSKKYFEISELKEIPKNLCGIYYLFTKSKDLIYIGKSTDISKRLKTHNRQNFINFKNKFFYFNFTPVSDEITSLLLESKEIKLHKPLFNKKLRRIKNANYFLSYSKNKKGIYYLHYSETPTISLKSFSSKKALLSHVNDFLKENGLCSHVNRLTYEVRPCFDYHLGKCSGICINENIKSKYNQKFLLSLKIKCLEKYGQLFFSINGLKYKAYYEGFFLKEFHTENKVLTFDYKSYDETKILLSYLKTNKIDYTLKY